MSANQAGKGDSPRPVNRAAWDATWERMEAAKRAKAEDGTSDKDNRKPEPATTDQSANHN